MSTAVLPAGNMSARSVYLHRNCEDRFVAILRLCQFGGQASISVAVPVVEGFFYALLTLESVQVFWFKFFSCLCCSDCTNY